MPWTTTWVDVEMLPVAISLDITFEEGNYADWPLLVVCSEN